MHMDVYTSMNMWIPRDSVRRIHEKYTWSRGDPAGHGATKRRHHHYRPCTLFGAGCDY